MGSFPAGNDKSCYPRHFFGPWVARRCRFGHPPFVEKRNTSAALGVFFKKTCRWVAFLPFACFSKAPPRAHQAGPGTYKQGCGLIASHHFRILAVKKIRKLEMKTNNNPINSNDAGLQPLPGARKRSTRSRCKHRAVCNATGRHRFGVLTAARPVHGSC